VDPQRALPARIDEAERDGLLIVAIDEALPDFGRRPNGFAVGQYRLRRGRGNVLVTVATCGSLDEVFLDHEIEAKRRRRAHKGSAFALRLQAETAEDIGDRVGRDRDAEQAGNTLFP